MKEAEGQTKGEPKKQSAERYECRVKEAEKDGKATVKRQETPLWWERHAGCLYAYNALWWWEGGHFAQGFGAKQLWAVNGKGF